MTARTQTATKPATARTKTARAIPHDERAHKPQPFDDVMRRYEEAREGLMSFFAVPTWKRTLVAFVSTIASAVGIGWVAGTLLDWLVVGALAMAVPAFIVFVVYLIGAIIAAYYGGKLCVRVGGAVLTGEADERAIAAYDAMKSAVKRLNPFAKPEIVPAKAR